MKIQLLIIVVLLLCALSGQTHLAYGQVSGEPAPPESTVNTTYPGPNELSGDIHTPMTSDELGTLLTNGLLNSKLLKLGDTIVLTAGTVYAGNFTLPKIDGPAGKWILIRTSKYSSLPAETKRVGTAHANNMPKIETPIDFPAIRTAPGAHHYRLVGLEIRVAASGVPNCNLPGHTTGKPCITNPIVALGSGGELTVGDLPKNIIVDRCYIHGQVNGEYKRGVQLNGASSAVIGSHIVNLHSTETFESQGVSGWNGTGPFKIENNYIEAAGENVFFGGSDPVQNRVPADIEILRNDLYKPTAWRHQKVVKNLLELKNARRVLIDGNRMENTWSYEPGDPCNNACVAGGIGQDGIAVLFTPRNEKAAINGVNQAPWTVVEDVMFRNNLVRHATGVFRIAAYDSSATTTPTQLTKRITITNNVFEDINLAKWGAFNGIGTPGTPRGLIFFITGRDGGLGPQDIHITHNVGFNSGNLAPIMWAGSACAGEHQNTTGFIFTDNIFPHNANFGQLGGIAGGCANVGYVALEAFGPPAPTFKKNIMMGGLQSLYTEPTGTYTDNYFPTSWGAVGFVNMAAGKYDLLSTSFYKDKGTNDASGHATAIGLLNATLVPKITPPAPLQTVRINAGGPKFVDSSGKTWQADDYYQTGYVGTTTDAINNTTDDTLYQSERYGGATTTAGDGIPANSLSYAIPLKNGSYTVRLHFAEFFFTSAGKRVFDVNLEGSQVLDNYDIVVAAEGAKKPKVESFQVTITDGILNIDAVASLNNAKFSAIEATPNNVVSPNFWQAPVNATVSGMGGGTLTKISSIDGNDSGARSTKSIGVGQNGYLECGVAELSTTKVCGLNDINEAGVGTLYTKFDFAIMLGVGNNVRVYENGITKGLFGTYLAGDKYRIRVVDGEVKYSRVRGGAESQFYPTSSTTPVPTTTNTLIAYAALVTGVSAKASIKDAKIVITASGSLPPTFPSTLPDIGWTNDSNVLLSGNTLTKQDGEEDIWDAGASSVQTLTGDGYVEFTAEDDGSSVICGLNTVDSNRTYQDLDYGIFLNANAESSLRIYEKGLQKLNVGTYMVGDRFRVAVEGDNVNYYRIRDEQLELLYSSPAPTSPVVVDTSLRTYGSNLSNVIISGAWE